MFFGIVAESTGAVVGCGFTDERNPIRGIGPVRVDRTFQGRWQMMKALLQNGKDTFGIRLIHQSFERGFAVAARCCPFVACKDGRIAAYTCAISALNHSVAETEANMQAFVNCQLSTVIYDISRFLTIF